MTEYERLITAIRVCLNSPVLVDNQGREFVVTGFKDDGKTALLSQFGGPRRTSGRGRSVFPENAMEIRKLNGFTVKKATT